MESIEDALRIPTWALVFEKFHHFVFSKQSHIALAYRLEQLIVSVDNEFFVLLLSDVYRDTKLRMNQGIVEK